MSSLGSQPYISVIRLSFPSGFKEHLWVGIMDRVGIFIQECCSRINKIC